MGFRNCANRNRSFRFFENLAQSIQLAFSAIYENEIWELPFGVREPPPENFRKHARVIRGPRSFNLKKPPA